MNVQRLTDWLRDECPAHQIWYDYSNRTGKKPTQHLLQPETKYGERRLLVENKIVSLWCLQCKNQGVHPTNKIKILTLIVVRFEMLLRSTHCQSQSILKYQNIGCR